MKLQLELCGGNRQKRDPAAREMSLFKHCLGPAIHAAMLDFIPEMKLNSLGGLSRL